MGKGSNRRPKQDENNVGCVWGLMHMLHFRRDPKFLMDAKQATGRHTFLEIADRGHSAKISRKFDERNGDDNIEDCTLQEPTIKKLMDDELGRVNLLKTIPKNEIQRRLADMGNDLSLDGISEHTNKTITQLNQDMDIHTCYLPKLVDSEGPKRLNHDEEYDLQSVLASFLGDINRCHHECPYGDCKSNSELCPSLKSLIHKKLSDLSNPYCNIDHEHSKEEGLPDNNRFSSSRIVQSKEFKDALEILGSNKELFLKLLQKPNSHMLENIRSHQNSRLTTKLEPNKVLGEPNFPEETRSSNHHELAAKGHSKESKHIFFWRKDKSKGKQMLQEGTSKSHPVSKIVILKPNPGRGIDQAVTDSARSLHEQPCTSQAPEYSGRQSSKFSIKEVRRRFRIVTAESRRERNAVPADDLQRGIQHSVIATKKGSGHHTEGGLAEKSVSDFKKDNTKPSTSSKQKQQNDNQTAISGHIAASQATSIFYEEAKKHLTDMLKNNDQSSNYPTGQISKSLKGLLSLPHCDVASPTCDLGEKVRLDYSSEDTDVCLISSADKEEHFHERSQSRDDPGSTTYCTSAADHVLVQEECRMKKEPKDVTDVAATVCIEGNDKLDCPEIICNVQCNPAEQFRDGSQLEMLEETAQEPVKMFPGYPESSIEKVDQQDPETPEPRASTKLISYDSPGHSLEKKEETRPISVLDSFYEDVADQETLESSIEKVDQQDPETPEPRASTKLISDDSPGHSLEKQEETSPISVLDSFYEDVADQETPESSIEKVDQQDPEAPEPRASTKLISDDSPGHSLEKQEETSPISVLDSFYEDVADQETPEPKSSTKLISYDCPGQGHKQEKLSPISLDLFYEDVAGPERENVKDYDPHQDFHGTLYIPDSDSDVTVLWEDKKARLDYIKLTLELSELCAEQNLEVWYLEDELISTCLFEELQNEGDQIDDPKLLFDCICESVTEIQEKYFRLSWLSFLKPNIRTPPVGENLISEVEKYIDGYLQYSFQNTPDQIVKRDLEVQTWMDIRSRTEGIVVEIWEYVLDELIDEAVFDLWI